MQGFNMGRYRPPDADPRRESFNARTGTHALGKRGRKEASQGILVVRFELPYTIWCSSCEQTLAQGTRYNAEKSRAGAYYSTPIWQFRCKCRHCQAVFVVRTDPKNSAYEVVEGGRRKNEQPDERGGGDGDDDDAVPTDGVAGRMVELGLQSALKGRSAPGEMRNRVERGGNGNALPSSSSSSSDPLALLDARTSAASKQARLNARVAELEEYATSRSADPYSLNSRLRGAFRVEKKQRLLIEGEKEDVRRKLGWREGVHVADVHDPRDDEEVTRVFKKRQRASGDARQSSSAAASTSKARSATARDTLLRGVGRRA